MKTQRLAYKEPKSIYFWLRGAWLSAAWARSVSTATRSSHLILIFLSVLYSGAALTADDSWRDEWNELVASNAYAALTFREKNRVRINYFDRRVAPNFPAADRERLRSEWDRKTLPKPKDPKWLDFWQDELSEPEYRVMSSKQVSEAKVEFYRKHIAPLTQTKNERKEVRALWEHDAVTDEELRDAIRQGSTNSATRLLISSFFGYWLCFLLTRKWNPFPKPDELGQRPKWFLGLGVWLLVAVSYGMYVSGELGESWAGRFLVRTMYLIIYSIPVIIAYFVYRRRIGSSPQTGEKFDYVSLDQKQTFRSDGDEGLYHIAQMEWDVRRSEALWTKAMTLESGDEDKAKFKYISLRVEQLKDRNN